MKMKRKLVSFLLAGVLLVSSLAFSSVSAESEEIFFAPKQGILPVSSNIPSGAKLAPVGMDLPARYSSREAGFTTPVRRQQNETCWAFGSLASFETLLLKNNIATDVYSAQHMNIWGTVNEDGTGWQRNSGSAGLSYIPLGYFMSRQGPFSIEAFPEESTESNFDSFSATPQYAPTSATYFNDDADRDSIKLLIYRYGSAVANFNSDRQYLSNNRDYYCADSTISIGNLMGHAVSVVGWEDNYPKENFSGSISGTPKENGAWIIKNSWGTYSGDRGYFYISYEDVWLFDKIFGPSYAITGFDKVTDEMAIYQNEIYGATYEFNYLGNRNDIVYMNVFDFSEKDRILDKVIFETTALGADYTVYYIPYAKTQPTSDTDLWQTLSRGTVTYTGYICEDFDNVEVPAGKGAIGIRINTQNTVSNNSIGTCEWLKNGSGYIFVSQAERDMSYLMMSSYIQDVKDIYSKYLNDDMGGTFVIKAITENPVPQETTVPMESTAVTDPAETTVPADTTAVTDPAETTVPASETTVPADTTAFTDPAETTAPATETTAPDTTAFTDPAETTVPATETTAPDTTSIPATSEYHEDTVKVYFTNSQGWENPTVRYWSSDGSTENVPLTFVRTNNYGYDIFAAELPADVYGLMFTCAEGTTEKIESGIFDGAGFYPESMTESGTWLVGTYVYSDVDTPTSSAETTAAETSAPITASTPDEIYYYYKLGDANLNGTVNVKDATYIQKFVANIESYNYYKNLAADVNDDREVNVRDATVLQKFVAQIDTGFRVGEERKTPLIDQ